MPYVTFMILTISIPDQLPLLNSSAPGDKCAEQLRESFRACAVLKNAYARCSRMLLQHHIVHTEYAMHEVSICYTRGKCHSHSSIDSHSVCVAVSTLHNQATSPLV